MRMRRSPNDDLIKQWKRVYNKKEEVDPDKEHNWESLCYGFFLAVTDDPKRSKSLANEMYMEGHI